MPGFSAQGTIGDSTSWVAEIDFANGNLRLKDVFVGLNSLPGVQLVKVGYFREPFSLEGATSSRLHHLHGAIDAE